MNRCIYILCGAALVVSLPLNARTPTISEEPMPEITATSTEAILDLPILPAELMAAGGCESNRSPHNKPRQFNADGSVVIHWNKDGSFDTGSFQINSVHIPEAKRRGLDLNLEADNYTMALILYKRHGIGIWYGYDPARKTCSYY